GSMEGAVEGQCFDGRTGQPLNVREAILKGTFPERLELVVGELHEKRPSQPILGCLSIRQGNGISCWSADAISPAKDVKGYRRVWRTGRCQVSTSGLCYRPAAQKIAFRTRAV